MPPLPRSLEVELGAVTNVPSVTGVAFIDQWEDVPELRHPYAVPVYDRMRKDAQCRAGLRAVIGPVIARGRWRLGREGVDPRVFRFCETEMGLQPEAVGRARRRREGISWRRYCREAVTTKCWAGHSVFEQVYRIAPPAPGQEGENMPTVLAHLRKLAPRPPRSLGDPVVAFDGGLDGWKQPVSKPGQPFDTVTLPIDRLVVHVHEQEGANWRGESLLRPVWKHWAVRDVLIRIGAMAVERNGLGIPVVTYDDTIPGVTRARAIAMAKAVRAGDEAGVALPHGYTLDLIGVQGQTRDELQLLKYHGEMIGRGLSAMVLDLGHDAGARSLGDTFFEVLCEAQNVVAGDFAEEVTEYVLRDLVGLNFGPDEPYPPLLFDEFSPDTMTWADIINMVTAGLVIPDDELELEIRRRANLPVWPGAADAPPEFDITQVGELPEGPALDIPDTGPDLPPGALELLRIFGYASRGSSRRAEGSLAGRLTALQARMAARDAALGRRSGA